MVLRFLRTQHPTGPVSLRGLTGPTIQQLKGRRSIQMASPNIGRVLRNLENFLFPGTPLEDHPDLTIRMEQVIGILERRRLIAQAEPFTGFNSPPGRF
jgi:hypothetical protein